MPINTTAIRQLYEASGMFFICPSFEMNTNRKLVPKRALMTKHQDGMSWNGLLRKIHSPIDLLYGFNQVDRVRCLLNDKS